MLGIASAALLAAIVGYLVWAGLALDRDAPLLTIAPAPRDDPRWLGFVVGNDGALTATEIAVALRLRDSDGRLVAERGLTIAYLPGNSEAAGAFRLPEDAEGLAPELAIEGYLDP